MKEESKNSGKITFLEVFTTFLRDKFKDNPRIKISEIEEIDQTGFWNVPDPPNIGRAVYIDGYKFIDYWFQSGKNKCQLYVRFPNGLNDYELEQFKKIAGEPSGRSKSKHAWTVKEKEQEKRLEKVEKAVEQAINNYLK